MSSTESLEEVALDISEAESRRCEALERLAEQADRQAVQVVVRACEDRNPAVGRKAAEVLASVFAQCLRRLDGSNQVAAGEAVGLVTEFLTEAQSRLATIALADDASPLRDAARDALETLREQTEAALAAIAGRTPQTASEGETAAAKALAPLPEPSPSEPCTVFSLESPRAEVGRIAPIVAEMLERPAADVSREINARQGILAEEVGLRAARDIVNRLRDAGIQSFVLGQRSIIELPPPERALTFEVSGDGVSCKLSSDGGDEWMAVPWANVFLVSLCRLEVREEKRRKVESRRLFQTVARSVYANVVEYRFLLDMFISEPWRRVRVGDANPDLSFVPGVGLPAEELDATEAAKRICEGAPAGGMPMNDAVTLLTSGPDLALDEDEGPWKDYTFTQRREFDAHNLWLVQLAKYGLLFA